MRLNGRFLCLFTEEKLVMMIVVSAHWDSPPLTHTTDFCVSCRTHCSFYSRSSFWKCLRQSKSCAQKLQCELKIFMQIYWCILCERKQQKSRDKVSANILFSQPLSLFASLWFVFVFWSYLLTLFSNCWSWRGETNFIMNGTGKKILQLAELVLIDPCFWNTWSWN